MRYLLALFLLGTMNAQEIEMGDHFWSRPKDSIADHRCAPDCGRIIQNYIVAEHKLVSFTATPTALIGFELRSLEQAPVRIVIVRHGNELTTDLPNGRKRLWVNKKEK